MTNVVVERGAVKTVSNVLVNVIVKVEGLSQTALTVLECACGDYQIKSNGAGINKVVFVGLDKVYEVEAQIPEVVNCIGADFANGILPVIFSVGIPTDELEDFLQSKIEPFEIILLDSYFKLNESYPLQILNFELQEDC